MSSEAADSLGDAHHPNNVPARAGHGEAMSDSPLPYRFLTGTDDREFCEKVSAALDEGYELYGSPALTSCEGRVVTGQAVIRRDLLGSEPRS